MLPGTLRIDRGTETDIMATIHCFNSLKIELVGYIKCEVTLQQLDHSLLICIRDRNLIVHVINRY